MAYFYAGSCDGIASRLKRESREYREGIPICIHTIASCRGKEGWHPYPTAKLFPICPAVGDTFPMKGYFGVIDDSVTNLEHKWWHVVGRTLSLSDPSAVTMTGIVELLVEVVDRPFPQVTPPCVRGPLDNTEDI